MKLSRVSIGLPVRNGENYLAAAIDSLLTQSYLDFELIISDNASTDATEEICRAYTARDRRVRYTRNAANLGAAPNYNRVFFMASGSYFKWAAHDDVCGPDFLHECVHALDRDPGAVLCYSHTATIDHAGKIIKEWEPRPALGAVEPHVRFQEALVPMETHPIWGMIRTDVLRSTPLFGSYPGHDLPLLAELSLHGRFHQVPRTLFYQREHGDRSVRIHDFRDPYRAVVWYDPTKAGKVVFPHWRLFAEYLAAIRRSPLGSAERRRCAQVLLPWLRRSAGLLGGDLVRPLNRVPVVGRMVGRAWQLGSRLLESGRWRLVAREIEDLATEGDRVILVGDCWFQNVGLVRRSTLPFLERDGQYFGLPADDETAIRELERMRAGGARFIVFAWPAFWWLDYYSGLARFLRSHFQLIVSDPRMIVFELK